MKLQRATLLGLYAIIELADQPDLQLSRSEIARKFDVSSNHLSKVMRELGKAGLVEAVRGVGGGYRFCGNARRTTLLDIIQIFEDFRFDSPDQREPGMGTEIGKALDLVLGEINESINSTLRSISLATMLMLKNRRQAVPSEQSTGDSSIQSSRPGQ
jgi:Rrf2 family protein